MFSANPVDTDEETSRLFIQDENGHSVFRRNSEGWIVDGQGCPMAIYDAGIQTLMGQMRIKGYEKRREFLIDAQECLSNLEPFFEEVITKKRTRKGQGQFCNGLRDGWFFP